MHGQAVNREKTAGRRPHLGFAGGQVERRDSDDHRAPMSVCNVVHLAKMVPVVTLHVAAAADSAEEHAVVEATSQPPPRPRFQANVTWLDSASPAAVAATRLISSFGRVVRLCVVES